jgi:membrane protease subunit HflK
MNGEPHKHDPEKLVMAEDAGSQALSDALRASFFVVRIVMVVLIAAFLFSGIRTVDSSHRAIKLRFGKPVGEGEKALLDPGLHWAWPPPIDEMVFVPFTQIQTVSSTIGWYPTTPEQEATKTEPPPGQSLNPASDGYVITGDANVIHVRATLQYRITDPIRYQFSFTNAPSLVTNALNEALLFAAAQYTVDNALTRDVTGFRDKVQSRLEQTLHAQQLGIEINPPTIQAKPPRQVADAFGRATQASLNAEETLNKARSYENEVLSKARSEAAGRVNAGESDSTRLVQSAAADAEYFKKMLPEYKRDPRLFTEVSQVQTLQRVLTNVQEKIFLPNRADGKSRELRLQLSREPPKPTVPQ